MNKTVACVIARTTSKRLPLKVLRYIYNDLSVLDFLISRIKICNNIDDIYICTSNEDIDDILEDVAQKNRVKIYRGDPENIIERMLSVAKLEKADILIRITGDNPLTSYEYIDLQIDKLIQRNLDYVRLIDVPIGATAEVMTTNALIQCSKTMDQKYSEYLMLYMFDPKIRKCGVIKPFATSYSHELITVDIPEDLYKVKNILKKHKNAVELKLVDMLDYFSDHPIQKDDSIQVKLPENKSIELSEFNLDMKLRVEQSVKIDI